MYEVLVYLLDRRYEEEVIRLFSGNQYQAYIAYEMQEAVDTCQQELYDLALIWPANYEVATDFLTVLNINFFNFIPVIAILDNPEQVSRVITLPIADYILLPVPRVEFYSILHQVVQDVDIQTTVVEGQTWYGIIEEYNLIDLIQMIEKSGQDALLTLNYRDRMGHVFFKAGKITRANFLGLTGLAALKKLSYWPRGNFQVKFSRLDVRGAEMDLDHRELLLNLIQNLSDLHKLYKGLPGMLEDILTNPLVSFGELDVLQRKILDICRTPIKIFDLLVLLEDEDQAIISALQTLFKERNLGKRQDVERQFLEEGNRGSLTKFLSSISSIFKRKHAFETEGSPLDVDDKELISYRIEVQPMQLNEEEIQKIQSRLEVST